MKCYSCDKVISQCECETTAIFTWAFVHGLSGSYLLPGFVKIFMNYKKMKKLDEIETSGEQNALNLMKSGIMTKIGTGEIKQFRGELCEKYPFLKKLETKTIGEIGGAFTGQIFGTIILCGVYGRITGYHLPSNTKRALLCLSLGSTCFLIRNNYLAANSYMYNYAKSIGKLDAWIQCVSGLSRKENVSLYKKNN